MRSRSDQALTPHAVPTGKLQRLEREIADVDPTLWIASRREAARLLWRALRRSDAVGIPRATPASSGCARRLLAVST